VTRYELLLFLHIAAAIIWIGAGFLLQVQAFRADRARNDAALQQALADSSQLAKVLFIPASLATLILGILLVLDGPWSFGDLWIVLGLAGYAATFASGVGLIEPRGKRIAGLMREEGGFGARSAVEGRKLLVIARIDMVVLFLVVADMTLKPTGDDVGTLVAMAAILVVAVAYFLWRAQSVQPRAAPAA
jgi:uncharacterized membrane protein